MSLHKPDIDKDIQALADLYDFNREISKYELPESDRSSELDVAEDANNYGKDSPRKSSDLEQRPSSES